MSVRHLALTADITGVPPTCKLLLYGLAVHAGSDGWLCATMHTLKRTTGLSERALRDNLNRLERLGYLERLEADRSRMRLVLL